MRRGRFEDQRGTEICFEIPDFLRKPEGTNTRGKAQIQGEGPNTRGKVQIPSEGPNTPETF